MEDARINDRLSRITTMWTLLEQAHGGEADAAAAARQEIMKRYGGAAYRYLLAMLRDPAAADDLAQEFALALVRGELRSASPERGRFRDYVKTVLFHLLSKFRKRQAKNPDSLAPEVVAQVAEPAADVDAAFDEAWREELLARTWAALAVQQPTYYAVLRFRADHPKMASHDMARPLTSQLGKPMTPDGVRQTLRRARELFTELLVDEVGHSLREPTLEKLEEELLGLNLLVYCRPALERRGGK